MKKCLEKANISLIMRGGNSCHSGEQEILQTEDPWLRSSVMLPDDGQLSGRRGSAAGSSQEENGGLDGKWRQEWRPVHPV